MDSLYEAIYTRSRSAGSTRMQSILLLVMALILPALSVGYPIVYRMRSSPSTRPRLPRRNAPQKSWAVQWTSTTPRPQEPMRKTYMLTNKTDNRQTKQNNFSAYNLDRPKLHSAVAARWAHKLTVNRSICHKVLHEATCLFCLDPYSSLLIAGSVCEVVYFE